MTALDVREEEVLCPSLRKAVSDLNSARGHPPWTLPETIDICIQVDTIHETQGICSTSRFRENRRAPQFVRMWVLACDFDWLMRKG